MDFFEISDCLTQGFNPNRGIGQCSVVQMIDTNNFTPDAHVGVFHQNGTFAACTISNYKLVR